jgi:hypothetical protein
LLRKPAAEEEEKETEDKDDAVGIKLTGGAPAAPVIMGPTVDEWMTGAPGPSLARHITPLASAEVPTEPPLFMVFDDSHPDVSPPGAEAIRMRTDASIGLRISDEATPETGLVEVVVGAGGEVETAKLISAPQNVHESMFLSAVKAWRFEPAVKDGHTVRYRQRMHVAVDP